MATAREIRRRIRSVKNISKVTGALEAVSASKVRRAQNAATASRAYSNAAFSVLTDLGRLQGGDLSHPLLDEPEQVNNILVILITSDRGLAGPYNTNILRVALDFEKEQNVPVSYLTVGKKGRDLLLRRGRNIIAEFKKKEKLEKKVKRPWLWLEGGYLGDHPHPEGHPLHGPWIGHTHCRC